MSKGQEMGWFEHGSTIIVFTPDGFNLMDGVCEGTRIKAGQAIMQIPLASPGSGPIDNSPVAARSSRSS
jgi:phosphatidylserine decarboxylase